ncbi:carboxymuconolactone decarboxylase family protein [Streptomyces sp. NPDC002078]
MGAQRAAPRRAAPGYFSETDRAALRLTEAITRVPDGHVSEEDLNAAAAVLTADEVSATAWLVTVMNAFNRVAITSRYSVGS